MFAHRTPAAGAHHAQDEKLEQFFRRLMQPMLRARAGRNNRVKLLVGLLAAITMSVLLVTSQQVVLKMLPFDNKSEFQVVVDLPEGSTLEQTQAVLNQVSTALLTLPEVTHLQTYAGTAAPMNFNGLVRQYYLRQLPWQGDVQVNLQDRHQRDEQSHAIALRVRPLLSKLEQSTGASIKLVEVPPGPPVMAPLVAEVYGPDYPAQLKAATQLQQQFANTPLLVDIDSTVEAPQPRWQLVADQQNRVAHDNTGQRYHADHRGCRELHAQQPVPRHNADNGERNRRHDHQRHAVGFKLRHHQQVNHDKSDAISDAHVAESLKGDLPLTIPLDADLVSIRWHTE